MFCRKNNRLFGFLLLVNLVFAPIYAQKNARPFNEIIDSQWAANDFWNDGEAEVAEYEAERVVYNEARPHTLRLITVTEDFNKDYWAKADWPYGDKPLLPVVKQNQVATIQTQNYPYHYMASVFFDRSNIGDAIKMTVASQEWCGNTFKECQLYKSPAVFRYSSYWDGQGTGESKLPNHDENTYFEEELPLLVRTLNFADGLKAALKIEPNQTTNKAPIPVPASAELAVSERSEDTWEVSINFSEQKRTMRFVVEREYPNILREYDLGDGRHYMLRSVERDAYWD